jgi:F-type H+-transporting ATPase subunit b
MLDIYPMWLLVMAVNFFILLIILNTILYKPLLKMFKERDDTVKGSLDAANDMNKKREDSIAQMNQELAEARSKAKEIFNTLKNEGLEKSKETIKAAEAETATILEKARAEVRAEAEKARSSLKAEVEKFSDEIVRKLVKV